MLAQPAYVRYIIQPQEVPQQDQSLASASSAASGVPGRNQQPQYISVPPIPQAPIPQYEQAVRKHIVPQPPPQEPRTQTVPQLLLPSNADRQVQKAAEQIAGPHYAQQVQFVQQQSLADQAITNVQRRAQVQFRRAQLAAQQVAQQQQQQQQQYQQQQQQQQHFGLGDYVTYQQPSAPITSASARSEDVKSSPGYSSNSAQVKYVTVPVPITVTPRYYQQQQEEERAYPQVVVKNYKVKNGYQGREPSEGQGRHGGLQEGVNKEEEVEEHDTNSSYQFGFDVKDDDNTNYQNRKEQRAGGKISGSYSVVDSDGYIRTVTYTADPKEGFKAEVVREPTDIVVKIPKPKEQEVEQQQQYISVPQRYTNHQRQSQPVQKYAARPQQYQEEEEEQEGPKYVYQYQDRKSVV